LVKRIFRLKILNIDIKGALKLPFFIPKIWGGSGNLAGEISGVNYSTAAASFIKWILNLKMDNFKFFYMRAVNLKKWGKILKIKSNDNVLSPGLIRVNENHSHSAFLFFFFFFTPSAPPPVAQMFTLTPSALPLEKVWSTYKLVGVGKNKCLSFIQNSRPGSSEARKVIHRLSTARQMRMIIIYN